MNRPMSWSNPWGMGESALYFACSSNCCSLRSKASLSKHGPLFHAKSRMMVLLRYAAFGRLLAAM